MTGTLPSNVDDAVFTGPNDDELSMWQESDSGVYWPLVILDALLEALPQVLARVVGR